MSHPFHGLLATVFQEQSMQKRKKKRYSWRVLFLSHCKTGARVMHLKNQWSLSLSTICFSSFCCAYIAAEVPFQCIKKLWLWGFNNWEKNSNDTRTYLPVKLSSMLGWQLLHKYHLESDCNTTFHLFKSKKDKENSIKNKHQQSVIKVLK